MTQLTAPYWLTAITCIFWTGASATIAPAAWAQTTYKCKADGTVYYADRPCGNEPSKPNQTGHADSGGKSNQQRRQPPAKQEQCVEMGRIYKSKLAKLGRMTKGEQQDFVRFEQGFKQRCLSGDSPA
jgi:hypothetical protein